MSDESSRRTSSELSTSNASLGTREMVGWGLLALGVVIGIWTFLQLYGLLTDPGNVALLEALSVAFPRDRSIVLPEGTVEIPAVFVKISAYGSAIALLAICAGIANTLVRAGARLVKR